MAAAALAGGDVSHPALLLLLHLAPLAILVYFSDGVSIESARTIGVVTPLGELLSRSAPPAPADEVVVDTGRAGVRVVLVGVRLVKFELALNLVVVDWGWIPSAWPPVWLGRIETSLGAICGSLDAPSEARSVFSVVAIRDGYQLSPRAGTGEKAVLMIDISNLPSS